MMPGFTFSVFPNRRANRSTPPGLMWFRNIMPTPIPIITPPKIALVMMGRWNNPFNGANRSIAVDVNTNPRMALVKYFLL